MKKADKKTVLITGAGGMVGAQLVRFFASKKYEVIGLYHEKEDAVDAKHTSRVIRADVSSKSSVQKIRKQIKHIDCIIHCAAMTEVNQCEENKRQCKTVNIGGTKNIVELADSYGAQVIFFSTPMVFSGIKGNYRETDKTNAVNFYGQTKADGEKIILKYDKGLVLRLHPIGIRPAGTHPSFIQWFFEAARENKSFTLFSDVWVNVISTATLAPLIDQMIQKEEYGILHVGSRDKVNKADIWKIIVKKFPKFSGKANKAPVKKTKAGAIAQRPSKTYLNTGKAIKKGYKMPKWRDEVKIVLKELF